MAEVICGRCRKETSDYESNCESCGESPLLEGRYCLVEVLGRHPARSTFRAFDTRDDEPVVVKEMDVGKIDDLKDLELVEREIDAIESITHDRVPRYLDDFEIEKGGSLYICLVQDHVDGQPLSECGKFDEAEVLEFIEDLAETLAHLHELRPPVLHRDIKPSNVIRRPDGRYALVDFGSVRREIEDSVGGSTVAGTMGYMAPEQYRGVATPASDLYGLGATAVSMMTGRQAQEIINPIEPRAWQAHVDARPEIVMFLQTLLAPSPDDRVQNASDVADRARRLADFEAPSESAPRKSDERGGGAVEERDIEIADLPDADRRRIEKELKRDWWRYEIEDFFAEMDPRRPGWSFWVDAYGAIFMVLVLFYIVGMVVGSRYGTEVAFTAVGILGLGIAMLGVGMRVFSWSSLPWRGAYREFFSRSIESLEGAKGSYVATENPWEESSTWTRFSPEELGPGAIIVAEEVSRDLAGDEKYFMAVEALDGARDFADRFFSEESLLHAVMLHRQAPILYRSPDHRERAIRERRLAEDRLLRAREATGRPISELVEQAVRERSESEEGEPLEEVDRRRIERRVGRRRLQQKLFGMFRQTSSSIGLLTFVTIWSGAMAVMAISTVALLVGTFGFGWPREVTMFYGGIVGAVLFLLYTAGGLRYAYSGRIGTSWEEEWFPDFDEVWPRDHELRGAFRNVADHAWGFSLEYDTLQAFLNRADSELDGAQESMVDELETIGRSRMDYVRFDDLDESVDVVLDDPIRTPRSRIAALEEAADGVLRCDAENGPAKAREYLQQAEHLRQHLLPAD